MEIQCEHKLNLGILSPRGDDDDDRKSLTKNTRLTKGIWNSIWHPPKCVYVSFGIFPHF
jgi:hypothetical protein